ncbi:hypothetical protein EYS14_15440 [Alteromonadaceae bacterium M269]|nr:hypothetical protein EYS14_15440 [Alteromonadaceae bacterium M269]
MNLSKKYTKDVLEACESFSNNQWGYFANAMDFDASTFDANTNMSDSYRHCMKNGCVVDAYCISSPVAIHQLNKIRLELKVTSPIEERLFGSRKDACSFINNYLDSL